MRILATMSGSSLDGLDIGIIEISESHSGWNYIIIDPVTISYSDKWKDLLRIAYTSTGQNLLRLHAEYAELCSKYILDYIREFNQSFNCISFHGHTIFHSPKEHFTFQLGNPAIIAAKTESKVVADFRSTDIALGGQGAPLMALADAILFQEYGACVNLGGICNISSFDIAPCNQILNALANACGKDYDKNGEIASQGKIQHEIVQFLHADNYYKIPNPKSLDNNYIRSRIIDPLIKMSFSIEDKMKSSIQFIAEKISDSIMELDEKSHFGPKRSVLFTGGGALNPILSKAITEQLKTINYEAIFPSKTLIEYKELLLMGLLAYLRIEMKSNIRASFTGASRDSISGAIYEG